MAEQTPTNEDANAQYRTNINVEQGGILQLHIGQGDNGKNVFETIVSIFQNLSRATDEEPKEKVEKPELSENDKSEESKKLLEEIIKIQNQKQSRLLTLCATLEYYAKIKDEGGFMEAMEVFNGIVKVQKDMDGLRAIAKAYESSKKYFRTILMTKGIAWWAANNNKKGGKIEPASAVETMASCIGELDTVWEAMENEKDKHQEDFSTPYFDSFCQEILQNLRDVNEVNEEVKKLAEAHALLFSSFLCLNFENWREGSDICDTAVDILKNILGKKANFYIVFGVAKFVGSACKARMGNFETGVKILDEAMKDVVCAKDYDESEIEELISSMKEAKVELISAMEQADE